MKIFWNIKHLLGILLIIQVATPLMAENENHFRVKHSFKSFRELDIDTIEFIPELRNGFKLCSDKSLEFIIPPKFHNRKINYVYVEHRKNSMCYDPDENGMDKSNPWIRIKAHDPIKNQWQTWKDQFGSDKRSAQRTPNNPKKNTFYNFPQFVGDFFIDKLRIENHGEGNKALATSYIHKLGVSFLGDGNRVSKKAIRQFSEYRKLNSLAIRYTLDAKKGLELNQNCSFEFIIPEEFQKLHLLYAVLKHRKDPAYAINKEFPDEFDPNAAYILCELKNKKTKLWHKWVDRSSKAKFSEIRLPSNPEDETLHNGLRTFGTIYGNKFRLTNIGKGEYAKSIASIHELELVFMPAVKDTTCIERIYTPETVFNNMASNILVPLFGGGARLGGKFPGAIALGIRANQRINAIAQLTDRLRFSTGEKPGEGSYLDGLGRLHIALPANKKLVQFEAALGDLDITSMKYNKDGYFGRSGKAEASIFIRNKDVASRSFCLIARNNIGMAGLIATGAPNNDFTTIEGDEIIIQVDFDVAFLMGFRIRMKN